MILYLDTSALVKKYFEEKNSSEVISSKRPVCLYGTIIR